jgi:hypothetical protein
MARIEASEIFKVLVTAVVVNTFFAVFLMTWVTKDDLSSLPDDLGDRFIHLFYFGVVSFTTTGYGDIKPKSNRLKIVMACYLLLVIAGVFSYFFRF